MKAMSALGFLFMGAGLLGLFYSHSLFSPSPLVIGLQAAAVALMAWARITFGRRSFHATADTTAGGLVTSGPFRYIRNPIYTSIVLFSFAGAGAHVSRWSAVFALVVLAGALGRIVIEERFLRVRYPEYAGYAARTKRMVPYVF
jgi:protein-S-isoprenylcysteine O-methyltransferase Ste14